jgi:hypothetical protein
MIHILSFPNLELAFKWKTNVTILKTKKIDGVAKISFILLMDEVLFLQRKPT